MFGFMRNGIICIAALTFLKAGLGQVICEGTVCAGFDYHCCGSDCCATFDNPLPTVSNDYVQNKLYMYIGLAIGHFILIGCIISAYYRYAQSKKQGFSFQRLEQGSVAPIQTARSLPAYSRNVVIGESAWSVPPPRAVGSNKPKETVESIILSA